MGFENPNINSVESDTILIKVDTYEFRKGDSVTVVAEDGTLENDWVLVSVGGKFAVAKKMNAGSESVGVPIPLDEFKRIQIQAREGNPQEVTHGHAVKIGNPEMRKMAEKSGIDTTKEGWQDEWNKKIRDITGV